MFHLELPRPSFSELEWILHIIFSDFLGSQVLCKPTDQHEIRIRLDGHRGELILGCNAINDRVSQWCSAESVPNFKAARRSFREFQEELTLPLIEGELVSTIFFLQSRYEEFCNQKLDRFGRFLSSSSAHSEWVTLPIADYCKIAIKELVEETWAGIQFRPNRFKVCPSHDIDYPSIFADDRPFRKSIGLIRSGHPGEGIRALFGIALPFYRRGRDPYDQIEWLGRQSAERKLKSCFYYVPRRTHDSLDPFVDLDAQAVKDQWNSILNFGHEIGIHPGVLESENGTLDAAVKVLEEALSSNGLKTEIRGGRTHLLKWSMFNDLPEWTASTLSYDSSLGFPDKAGFRCGTCFEYPLYDVANRNATLLLERPLILMDCTLMDSSYEGLGTGVRALEKGLSLKNECRRVGGCFNLLWHNTRLIDSDERALYLNLLDK